jgi:FtsP/CotA-like multicopper oxidase with cupredoxin domain
MERTGGRKLAGAPVIRAVSKSCWSARRENHPLPVISHNGQPNNASDYSNIVNVPAGGEVVVRVPVDDFTGKFVFHCHIFLDEDNGMMAAVEVTA